MYHLILINKSVFIIKIKNMYTCLKSATLWIFNKIIDIIINKIISVKD